MRQAGYDRYDACLTAPGPTINPFGPDNPKSAWKARLQQPRGMPYGTGPSRKRLVQGELAKAPRTRQPERRKPGVHCVWDHSPEMALTAE
jgi:hypothetical protein